jgi:hypothetical protein
MAIYFAATDPQAKQQLSAVISDASFARYSEMAITVPGIVEHDTRLRPG